MRNSRARSSHAELCGGEESAVVAVVTCDAVVDIDITAAVALANENGKPKSGNIPAAAPPVVDDDDDDDDDEDDDDEDDDDDRNDACPSLKSLMNIMLNALPSAHFMHTLVAPASTSTSAQTSSAARSTSSTCTALSRDMYTRWRKCYQGK
jgi:hypothetical protein